MKNAIIGSLVVVLLGLVGFYFYNQVPNMDVESQPNEDITNSTTTDTTETNEGDTQSAEGRAVIGVSAGGKDIEAYTYGTGDTHLLFVGGIHGGYSWNTALVAYELIDHLEENTDALAEDLKVTVIPVLNPDGLETVVGTSERFPISAVPTAEGATIPGRFNSNNVDLNRNFDCDWQASGTWQNQTVSGGGEAFSEPEAQAFKAYVEANDPEAVVVWYSAAGGVYASNCHEGVLPETQELTNLYANAAGYSAHEDFEFYQITGDMANWLARINVPAISVLLTTHRDVEWSKNQAGVEALFDHYSGE